MIVIFFIYTSLMYLGKDLFREEGVDRFRLNGKDLSVYGDGYALLAVSQAESTVKVDLPGQSVQRNEILQLFQDLLRPFYVTGASYAYRYIDHFFSSHEY